MIRSKLAAIAAGTMLAFTGTAAAHAGPDAPVQVKIYLENNNHNPGTVTADCGPHGAVLHTTLFNDAIGANVVETAVVYAEPANPAAGLGTIVAGPVDVPIAGHINVALPYQAGLTFDAVAVAKGDPLPTSIADLIARLTAKPPTADNSQLLPSGYPADPKCPPPVPNPCDPKPGGVDLKVAATCPPCPESDVKDMKDSAIVVHPTCVPATEPSKEPSHTPTSSKPSSSVPSSSAPTSTASTATASGSVSATPSPTGTPAASATPTPTASTSGLAHTGASVVPFVGLAVLLLAAGVGTVAYSRRARRH